MRRVLRTIFSFSQRKSSEIAPGSLSLFGKSNFTKSKPNFCHAGRSACAATGTTKKKQFPQDFPMSPHECKANLIAEFESAAKISISRQFEWELDISRPPGAWARICKISSSLFVTIHWAIIISFRENFPWIFVSKMAQQTTEMSQEIFTKNRFFWFSRPCRAQLPNLALRFLGSRAIFGAWNKTV